ncbi:MAG: HU family DNA-binding protein [Pseudonocardia sp.]|nr:HU family DNA-binding protein [Pseudonocardia sp.]
MNKAELITALAEHLEGDRRAAGAAVDGLLDVIVRTVQAGDSVSLTGFGVFEQRQRAARSGRNPRTGQTIQVPATVVPAFRPGTLFRDVVSGARELGEAPARPAHVASRPQSRPVASALEGTLGEVVAQTSGKATAVKAGKDVKAGKAGKGEKSAKDGAKGGKNAKVASGKGGKKKSKK